MLLNDKGEYQKLTDSLGRPLTARVFKNKEGDLWFFFYLGCFNTDVHGMINAVQKQDCLDNIPDQGFFPRVMDKSALERRFQIPLSIPPAPPVRLGRVPTCGTLEIEATVSEPSRSTRLARVSMCGTLDVGGPVSEPSSSTRVARVSMCGTLDVGGPVSEPSSRTRLARVSMCGTLEVGGPVSEPCSSTRLARVLMCGTLDVGGPVSEPFSSTRLARVSTRMHYIKLRITQTTEEF